MAKRNGEMRMTVAQHKATCNVKPALPIEVSSQQGYSGRTQSRFQRPEYARPANGHVLGRA